MLPTVRIATARVRSSKASIFRSAGTIAHYGLTAPVTSRPGATPFSPDEPAAGTQEDPDFFFAGSELPGSAARGTLDLNYVMARSSIMRPAETVLLTEGVTAVDFRGFVNGYLGCETASMYRGGGNVVFQDGHVRFVKGNSERYLERDSDGRYFKKFYTVDR
jgi:prepilin-type processing-associated H-X9-DG protein